MAVQTRAGSLIVCFGRMTEIAVRRRMGSKKREIGLVVIKGILRPTAGAVTVFASFSQTTRVRVVLFVAAYALARGFPVERALLVARLTGQCMVSPIQDEIGITMVKNFRRKTDNICASPSVICVTHPALHFASPFLPSMKPCPGPYVRRDQIVADHAEIGLSIAFKGLMTVLTIIFGVCMRQNHRARHDHQLEIDRVGRTQAFSRQEAKDGCGQESAAQNSDALTLQN